MKHFFFSLAILLLIPVPKAMGQDASPLNEVNLFLGTADDYGQLAPGACMPFGQIQVCPDSRPRQHAGYDYDVPLISGISINRLSGTGGQGCGGNVSLYPANEDQPLSILKETEQATPGFYATQLSNGVELRLTASRHMAVEQYVFPENAEPTLILNPASSFEQVFQTSLHFLDNRSAQGYLASNNTCRRGLYHLYYRIYFNRSFSKTPLQDGRLQFRFKKSKDPLEVRIVVSTGLAAPLEKIKAADVWKRSFADIQQEAEGQWKDILNRVSIKGGNQQDRIMFYTSLYRVMHSPFQVTDTQHTSYLGTDGKPHTTKDFQYYSSWSLWDTYRTKFPLIQLLQPERSHDIMRSIAQLYITGKQDWSTTHECVPTVRTEHAIATLLDGLRMGNVSASQLQPAFQGMEAEARRLPLRSPDQVLETATDFWALSQLASELGLEQQAKKYMNRGEVLFDSIWPRHFMTIDSSYTLMRGNGLYQGTRWQYRWAAPMFQNRMEKLLSRKQLAQELTDFFRNDLYNQGNEPDIHVPFLFGRFGKPQLTGTIVRRLADDSICHRYGGNDAYPTPFIGHAFRNAPRGYAPEMDEDDGTMSAWYVFSALGFYPTIVGEGYYDLFSPLFDEACVLLGKAGERRLTIKTHRRTSTSQPLKRVSWNGRTLKDFRISYTQLLSGGALDFWY
ncbi:MAG: glycoside hydrolase family 92 protein [Bacteroidaceae bacterium]|nr:glycoside hydrolase family 92 protein [Bacteroidaceae bacterium]